MKCQNCGATSHVRDRYNGLCFTCAWPTNVTTPKPATAMGAEMARVTTAVKCARPRCTNAAMLPLQSNGDGWLCRGHAGQPLVGPIEDEQRLSLQAAADVQARMLHAAGIQLTSLTFVEGHPVTGVGVLPSIRHDATGLDLATFQWHEEARVWSVSRNAQAIAAIVAPKPPTLREWLGDRVSELGPWADVLREQPVPAGMFQGFEWNGSEWRGSTRRGSNAICRIDLLAATGAHEATAPAPWLEAVQMAFFTRHPAVLPEPAPLRTWFGNEEEL